MIKKKGFPQHDYYKQLFDTWEFYLYSYEGGKEYIEHGGKNYLFSHVREQKNDYKFRSNRAVFESVSQVILNVYQSHIRRKGIQRSESENKNYQEFYDNCDLEGHNLNHYMLERVLVPAQVFGFTYIMIDLPRNGEEIKTEYQRQKEEIRPYLINYFPTEVPLWQWNRGKFDWIVFKESDYENIENPLDLRKSPELQTYYKIWYPDQWIKTDENLKVVDQSFHKWGEIPITVFYNRESLIYDLPVGLSALKTIAELDRKVFNLSSLLDEFLYRQCFAQLVMDSEMIGKIIESGTTRVLPIAEDKLQPFFLEPPVGGAEFIVSERDRTIDSAYRHAMIRGDSYVTEDQTAESGVAKAYDLHDSQQNIAQKSRNMESGENRIHELLKEYHGEITAEYPTEFDIKTINEELAESLEFFKADFGSVSYNRHRAMKLIERDLQNADPELLKKIRDEIDEVNPGLSFEQRMRLLQESLYDTYRFMLSVDPELKNLKEDQVKEQFQKNVEMKQKKEGIKPEPTLKELIE